MDTAASFAPVAASTGQTVKLAMQRLWLSGQILPAGARLVVQHVFQCDEANPIEVIYAFPLPRDAALRSFRISGEGFQAHSELKTTEAAVKAYEEGLSRGALSTLARQYGDGVVNLTVGNIRPKETVTVHLEIMCGVELRDDGFRFRFPFTLAPAYHARAKCAETVPGDGEMELPAGEFGDVILPRFRDDASSLHEVGFDLSVVSHLELDEIGSPSHSVKVKQAGGRTVRVALARAKDLPDRDLVLDVRYASVEPQVLAGRGKDGKGYFAVIVPSSAFGGDGEKPRRVVILLDRSGSMQGIPLAQARKAIDACLGALAETDSFGLVAFDTEVSLFETTLVAGTRKARDKAHRFLMTVEARGGTELSKGVLAAAKLFDGEGGDILVFTDGQVAGTETILTAARSAGVRLHCLGIGGASQDRFLALLARETGGVSRFVTPSERVDLPAVDLFASIGSPVASGLKASVNIQPEPPSSVFAGTPVLLFGEGDTGQENQIELTWTGGQLNLPVQFSESDAGETVRLLQGARLITDWESRYPSAEAWAPLEKRKQSRVAARLLELSQTYGLASREMSLVAVVSRSGDRPGALPDTRVVPVGMPADTAFQAYFLTQTLSAMPLVGNAAYLSGAPEAMPAGTPPDKGSLLKRMTIMAGAVGKPRRRPAATTPPAATNEEVLLELAALMDSDGGLPGKNNEWRASATVVALLAFLSQGHTQARGAFRSHVARLVSFLNSLTGLSSRQREIVEAVTDHARQGSAPAGPWLQLARTEGLHWKDVESAVLKA